MVASPSFIYIAITTLMVVIGTGTVVYHHVERLSWVDSFYFSAMVVTTVGFGDFVPTTAESKIFTVFFSMTGIGILFYTLTNFASIYFDRRQKFFLHEKRFEEAVVAQALATHKKIMKESPEKLEARKTRHSKKRRPKK